MCSLRLRPPESTGFLEGPGGFWRVLEGAGLCLLPPTCPDVHDSCTPRAVNSAWLCCLADVDKTSWANWSKQESWRLHHLVTMATVATMATVVTMATVGG